jgi:hypothetical protein
MSVAAPPKYGASRVFHPCKSAHVQLVLFIVHAMRDVKCFHIGKDLCWQPYTYFVNVRAKQLARWGASAFAHKRLYHIGRTNAITFG